MLLSYVIFFLSLHFILGVELPHQSLWNDKWWMFSYIFLSQSSVHGCGND